MKAEFYYNKSDSKHINKEIDKIRDYDVTLKENCNIKSPIIKINANLDEINDLIKSNYCYIPNFNRYYYIISIDLLNNNIIQFSLNVDVLMSFKKNILENSGIIKRNENKFNLFLDDNDIETENNIKVNIIKFPNQHFVTYETHPPYDGSEVKYPTNHMYDYILVYVKPIIPDHF